MTKRFLISNRSICRKYITYQRNDIFISMNHDILLRTCSHMYSHLMVVYFFYVTVILINIYNMSTGWYPHATQFHCGYNFVVLSMFPEIRWSVFTRVIFSDSSGIHAERFWQSLLSSSIVSTRHLVVYDPIWFSRYMKLWVHIWCCWPYHSPVHQ